MLADREEDKLVIDFPIFHFSLPMECRQSSIWKISFPSKFKCLLLELRINSPPSKTNFFSNSKFYFPPSITDITRLQLDFTLFSLEGFCFLFFLFSFFKLWPKWWIIHCEEIINLIRILWVNIWIDIDNKSGF